MSTWPPNLRMRTITTWPGERKRVRRESPFQAGLSDTLELLDRELRMLRATDIWLEVAIPTGEFRLDGRPRANARAMHPGVVVSFQSHELGKDLRYATDRFWGWQHNLRAGGPSADRGRELIRRHGSVRAALHATHPDHGGDPSDFADVQAAREEGTDG